MCVDNNARYKIVFGEDFAYFLNDEIKKRSILLKTKYNTSNVSNTLCISKRKQSSRS